MAKKNKDGFEPGAEVPWAEMRQADLTRKAPKPDTGKKSDG